MQTLISNSEEETRLLAEKLAKQINRGVVALSGDLGAGKTTFVQGFAQGLGIKEKIISPTFVLIRQHQIPGTDKILFHIDLYRLEDNANLKYLGINEIVENPNYLVLVEWAEKLKELPQGTIKISIKKMGKNKRKFLILKS